MLTPYEIKEIVKAGEDLIEDRFTQDGLLTIKRHCPKGPEQPADVYLDDMRSPLPLPQLIFYR